jgi:hypothetical protein
MSPADVAAAVAAAGLPLLSLGAGVLVREGKPEVQVCLSSFHMGDITGNHVKLYELVSSRAWAGPCCICAAAVGAGRA